MARQENLRQAEAMAEVDPLLVAFPRPHDVKSMSFQVARIQDLAGSTFVGYDARLDQAARALVHLTRLAETQAEHAQYDLFRVQPAVQSALATPSISTIAPSRIARLGAGSNGLCAALKPTSGHGRTNVSLLIGRCAIR